MTADSTTESSSGGDELTRFGLAMLQLIDEASTNSSYKYALLVALIDAASENVGRGGLGSGSVTSRQLAVHVLDLYWPQARPWPTAADVPPQRLKAIATNGRSIVDHIVEAIVGLPERTTAEKMRELRPARWTDLLEETERILIRYPIARLQQIGGESTDLLYPTSQWPLNGIGLDIARYQRDLREGTAMAHMDNRIRFQPGVEVNLARLAPLLRPLVMDRWARWTERSNALAGETTVHEFLFGRDRVPLGAVRQPLRALQRGLCFYCDEPLGQHAPVDHFIPWSRTGSDDLFNLVVAHPRCNSDKSDHLAAFRHAERWRERLDRSRDDILEAADHVHWSADPERARGSAYTSYWVIGEGTRLWLAKNRVFEPYDPRVLDLLTA